MCSDDQHCAIRNERLRSGVSVLSVDLLGGAHAPAGFLDHEETALWEAPEPEWVREAYTAALRDDLAAATTAPVDRGALALISLLNPEQLSATACSHPFEDDDGGALTVQHADAGRQAARMLLDGIVVSQRLINHVQAIQQRLIAAFCRPGVALPLSDLLDLAGNELGAALAAAADAVENAVASTAEDPAHAARGTDTAPQTSVDTDVRRSTRRGQFDPIEVAARPGWAAVLRQTAVKAASAEIGCALRLAPVTARIRCETALALVDHYPATVAGQQAGDIDSYRARLVSEALAVLPRHLRPVVERRVLPAATTGTVARLRRLIGREVIAADPAAAEARVERAKGDRTVVARRGENNSGIVTAIISAADAELASATLDAMADGLARSHPDDTRTHAQLRADAFTDLFRSLATTGHVDITGGHGSDITGGSSSEIPAPGNPAMPGAAWCGAVLPTGAAGTVAAYRRPVALNVYIDAATLAKLDEQPGELAGHGAITASMARALAASADTIRAILVRPVGSDRSCETVLDAGRAVYRPPDRVADYVVNRDKTCTFPGCRTGAERCDLDHRRPFDSGGETCPCNLDSLCRRHHRMKTFTAWRGTPDPTTGRLRWISPLGRNYPTEQAHLLYDRSRRLDGTSGTDAASTTDAVAGGFDDPPPF